MHDEAVGSMYIETCPHFNVLSKTIHCFAGVYHHGRQLSWQVQLRVRMYYMQIHMLDNNVYCTYDLLC